MKSLSLAAKLRAMAACTCALMLALSGFAGVSFYKASMDLRLRNTRAFVQTAQQVAEGYLAKAKAGTMSKADAQAQAAAEIGKLRYDGSEYVWINDLQPRMVMHPIKPEMNGEDLSSFKDPDGKRLFVAFVDVVRSAGQGEVQYLWPKPGQQQPEAKRSYVSGVPEWGWVLGSGVYIGEAREAALRFALSALAIGMTASLMVIGFVVAVVRSLRRGMAEVEGALGSMASGDLTTTLDTHRDDEIGRLMRAVNHARDGLRDVVAQVQSSTDCIASASSEIAAGNSDLSQRTEQASGNLQSTASAMSELTEGVRQSAALAEQASVQAGSASKAATHGGAVVTQVVQTMQEISTSSRRISDIIGVIDGIAFQTNILALNAAVESARAGEHGRGFAVVAGEVRTLAKRSAEAAREIKGLIGGSVERVEIGARLVGEAGQAMHSIVESVRQVTQVVGEIASSAQAQSHGLTDVNSAVAQLDQMTQQNAALVEQSAASAESLREQSHRLSDAVRTFRLA